MSIFLVSNFAQAFRMNFKRDRTLLNFASNQKSSSRISLIPGEETQFIAIALANFTKIPLVGANGCLPSFILFLFICPYLSLR
ncbi:MAG: hypothetical protein HC785_16885 [Calothrix sp. CSU_2_0]|nr:hypothetical protein [Calothrix sp. CSU_2_0]